MQPHAGHWQQGRQPRREAERADALVAVCLQKRLAVRIAFLLNGLSGWMLAYEPRNPEPSACQPRRGKDRRQCEATLQPYA